MTDRVREVAPGDPVRADDWNVVAAAANAFARTRWRLGRPGVAVAPVRAACEVLVRNDTGGPLPAFCPVRLGAVLTGLAATPIDPYETRDRPLYAGLECDGTSRHVVLLEAMPENAIGRAAVLGHGIARVPSGAAAGDMLQPPSSGNDALVAGGGFAKVLFDAVGTGDVLAPVLIGGAAAAVSVVQTVRATAANDGTQWSSGRLVMTGDPLPPLWGGGAASGEVVEIQPLYGTVQTLTFGSVTVPFGPHKLVSGVDYPLAHDSGTRGPTSDKRRLYVLPTGLIGCGSDNNLYGL